MGKRRYYPDGLFTKDISEDTSEDNGVQKFK